MSRKSRQKEIRQFKRHIQNTYWNAEFPEGDFGPILCYELHSQPVNPRMEGKTMNDGYCTGLTFKELAAKWGISVTFLGELIADHCRRLDG